MNKLTLLLLAPTALLASAAYAQVGGAADVTSRLQVAGYSEVRDIEFDGGVWEAEVRRADGRWGEVAMDATTGEIFDAKAGKPMLDARGVAEALEAAGYTEITDLDRDGGLWEAEARDKAGTRVELRLAGQDGRVLSSDVEYDD